MGQFLSLTTRAALDRLISLDDNGLDDAEATEASEAPEALKRVSSIRSLIAELEAEPATLNGIRAAVAAGATWDEVAEATGLKPAAAKWRWQGSDDEIQARHEAGRKRSARPSSIPTDLPGYSVAELAEKLGVTPQAIYLQVRRGSLTHRVVELSDGRSYKRVFPGER